MELSTNTWTVRKNYSFERQIYNAKSLYNSGEFIVFGGYDGYDPISRIASFNPKKDEWKILGNMNTARSQAAVILKNDEFLVAGGYTITGEYYSDKCAYSSNDELVCRHQNPIFSTTSGKSL